MKTGILLCNLGSPDAPTAGAVRPYLREFLSDDRVIDAPKVVQQAILNLFILPFRPRKSAEAYEKVWTDEGSPLIISTYEIQDKLQKLVGDVPIAVGMRYGKPSTESAVRELMAQGVEHVFMVPLYPHYAMSSYETAVVKVKEVMAEIAPHIQLSIQPPFWDDEDYIDALIEVASPHLEDDYDMLLFSYHGVPERHIRKGDPSGCYCLNEKNCCEKVTPVQSMCYRAQCIGTSRLFARRAGIPDDKWMVSFQSRLGPDPWLTPATDTTLEHFPSEGTKRVVVMCPAFISDCLETLEEINMEGREEFMEAGGEEFRYIPCLNSEDPWIAVLERMYHDFKAGSLDRSSRPPTLREAPAAAGE
jgi:ferrochelatase